MVHERREARVDGNGRAYAGSQRQIQAYVNESPQQLSFGIAKAFSAFRSAPMRSNGYRHLKGRGTQNIETQISCGLWVSASAATSLRRFGPAEAPLGCSRSL